MRQNNFDVHADGLQIPQLSGSSRATASAASVTLLMFLLVAS